MKMKNFGLILLAPFMVMKIEGMEDLKETSFGSTLSCPFPLQVSLRFGDLFVEKIEQDPVEAAALYREVLQLGRVQEFEIQLLEMCELQIHCDERESEKTLNPSFYSSPTIQRFKDQYETLKFLRLLEESTGKHQPYVMKFREQYEDLLKNNETESKREQAEAIPTITALYNRIKEGYSTIIPGGVVENIISTFELQQCDGYKSLHISVGNDNDIKYILVHFNNLDETYLFLQELSNLKFLNPSIVQKVEAIIGSVATLINAKNDH